MLFTRLKNSYANFCITLVHTAALAALTYAGYTYFNRPKKVIEVFRSRYSESLLEKIYVGKSKLEVDQILNESWGDRGPYAYEPYAYFREPAYRGKWVNVAPEGYRFSKNQAAWPPDDRHFNVFIFGGSTTFSYGLTDEETVASQIQTLLQSQTPKPIAVYNFGSASYYSTQERIRFERLLARGFVPNFALFIDGLNDFFYYKDLPAYNDLFESVFQTRKAVTPINDPVPTEKSLALAQLDSVIDRWAATRKIIRAIAREYHFPVRFVWQPTPFYHYDLNHHPFFKGDYSGHIRLRAGYERMASRLEKVPPEPDLIRCTEIQAKVSEPLYVDLIHYAPGLARELAHCIVDNGRMDLALAP